MGALIIFVVLIVAPCVALGVAYVTIFHDGAKDTGRWGVHRKRVPIHDASPYRAGESEEEVPRGAPIWLRITSGLSVLGGVATAMFLAPMGLLLMLIVADRTNVPITILVLLVSSSGFAAGTLWFRAARRAVRHEAISASVVHYLYLHHVAVALTMFGVDAYARLGVALFSMPICVFAIVCVFLLKRGSRIQVDHAKAPAAAPVLESEF